MVAANPRREMQRHVSGHNGRTEVKAIWIWRSWEDQPTLFCCCGVSFKRESEFKRHILTKHSSQVERCGVCHREFTRKDNLTRHMKMKHNSDQKPQCSFCNKRLSRKDAVQRHEGTCHSNPNRQPTPQSTSPLPHHHHHHIQYLELPVQQLHPIIRPQPLRQYHSHSPRHVCQ